MAFLSTLLGVFFVLVVLADAFETVVLPRTVKRRIRLSNIVFETAGRFYSRLGRARPSSRRQAMITVFGPLLLLFLIMAWAVFNVLGWGFIHYGLGTPFNGQPADLGTDMYFSGVTFLTLGYGDVVPSSGWGRSLAVAEAGLGFGFLALVVSYVPVLYNAFSRREVQMLLLDVRAGSNPMGSELLYRYAEAGCMGRLTPILKDWERFGAELLESYLSYPILAYYRSQHDDQSWLKSLTAVMDACALIEMGFKDDIEGYGELKFQARATFAMARHVMVDLAYILDVPPERLQTPRLCPDQLAHIRNRLDVLGYPLRDGLAADNHLEEIRAIYEPYAVGLAGELLLDLPEWCTAERQIDNWQTSAWEGVKHF